MTQIIGFAGKKQSGKNTACNFILAAKIAELGISKSSRLNKKGEIEITDIFDDSISNEEWFEFKPPHVDVQNLFDNELGKFIKLYSFAEKLKQMSIDILGLKEEQVFGSDKQKNSKTHINWKDMPGESDRSGLMTAREVLQYLGTDIFRSIYKNVWVDACLRQIETEASELALISDVRFENEVTAIQNKGGLVIGLKRSPYKKSDKHASETQVEKCFDICDTVIDNSNLSIPQQNKQIYLAIKNLENVPEVIGD
tara:strand:- start:190 stop:951 length:762 start_codon:yes stop_codon:yes gene_type:complete